MAESSPSGLAFEAGGLDSRAGSWFSASLDVFCEQCTFLRGILGVTFTPPGEITKEELDSPHLDQSGELGLDVKPL